MASLEELRKKVDEVDEQIAALLAQRSNLVGQVADAKRELDMPPVDRHREADVADNWIRSHRRAGGLYADADVAKIARTVCDAHRFVTRLRTLRM